MTTYETAKMRADTTREAIKLLGEVREKMLGLVPDILTSKDFSTLNALEDQLRKVYEQVNTDPAFGSTPTVLKFEDFMKGEILC